MCSTWSCGRCRCAPGSAASTCARACCCAGRPGGASSSPFRDYDDAECLPWLRCAREAADVGWPQPVRTAVPVNVTVPAVGPDRAGQIVLASDGCRTAKVKVAEPGQLEGDDIARVEAVRDALGPDGAVRVDANGALGRRHRRAHDPAARPGGRRSGVRRAAVPRPSRSSRPYDDRSTCRSPPTSRSAGPTTRCGSPGSHAADVAVLKVQPLGGVAACLRIAEQIGLPVVVSSALETSVGIAAGVALAAALPELPYACGLATCPCWTATCVGAVPRRRRRARGRPAGARPRRRGAPPTPRPTAPVATAARGRRLPAREPVDGAGDRPRRRAGARRRPRGGASRRGRATRRCRSRCTPPTRPGVCGCTCASTSARRLPGARPGEGLRPAGRRSSRRPARRRSTCTRPWSRPTYAGVPLLVLTADRPPSCAAPAPTRPSTRSRSTAARCARSPSCRSTSSGPPAAWRHRVAGALRAGRDGPVHLNVAFREPLVPDGDPSWPEPLAATGERPAAQETAPGFQPVEPGGPHGRGRR